MSLRHEDTIIRYLSFGVVRLCGERKSLISRVIYYFSLLTHGLTANKRQKDKSDEIPPDGILDTEVR